ncbi:hypothetical protein Tco_0082908, partial [Tanacetum coccineum]
PFPPLMLLGLGEIANMARLRGSGRWEWV